MNTKRKFKSRNDRAIVFTVIIGILILLVLIPIAYFSLVFQKEQTIHYNDSSNLDYNVYLKPNEFYDTPFLPKDKTYISTLIDYIKTSFNYKFTSQEDIELQYSYYITAEVLVDNAQGKNIFNREETIVYKKSFNEAENNTFSIDETVNVDYGKYNALASSFISNFDIQANSKVVVSLYVDVVGKHNEFENPLTDKAVISLEIPLTNKTLDISMNYKLSNNVNSTFQYKAVKVSNPALFIVVIFFAILDISSMTLIIVLLIKYRSAETIYAHKLNKILRDYDRYISETSGFDESMAEDLRFEYIQNFVDFIDVRDGVEKPILLHEEIPGKKAIFYIIDDKVVYVYIMRAEDMKKKN